MMPTKTLYLRIPEGLHDLIAADALATGRTLNGTAVLMLTFAMRHRRQMELEIANRPGSAS